MALLQGSQLPDVTKVATQTPVAPDWYNSYLKQSADATRAATPNFVGAQPNQQQAFGLASTSAGNWQPDLQAATNLIGQSTSMSAAGALSPFTTKAGGLSALQAGQPNIDKASGNVYDIVGNYMNPYTTSVVNEIGRLGQENITRNLAPAATSGAAGTGQFGSRRGAQVLGNVISDALADVSGKQSQALFTGYDQATKAAQTDLARQLQAGVAAGQLTDADAGRILQAGELTGKYTGLDMANLMTGADLSRSVGATRGALSTQDINNLLKTGEIQRQIATEQEMFPIMVEQQKLNALRGLQVPVGQVTTTVGPEAGAYGTSPLSAITGIGATIAGISKTPFGNWIGGLFDSSSDYSTTANAIKNYGVNNVFTPQGGGVIGALSTIQDPYQ